MKNAPCYKCGKRHEACHADCPEYSAWVKARAEEKGKGRNAMAGGYEADTFLIDKQIRMKKRMGGAK
jgi:hypothetical protein